MKSIIYFSRSDKAGYSIQKVFKSIINNPNNFDNRLYKVPCYRANLISLVKNLLFVYKRREKNKIHHITGDIHYCVLVLLGFKSVLTVHDLAFIKNTNNRLKKFLIFLFWYYLPIKFATKVVCISEKTKKEIQYYIKRKDIDVITNPISNEFINVYKEFNFKKPNILHIGTGWNKNLTNVIKSLQGINCTLRVIGKVNNKDLKLLKMLNIDFSNVFDINDNEILEEYIKADIISFPSIFEGFGMPIIEGQAIGRVVLTSNISPMKEIGNTSVELVDPSCVESLKNSFITLINNKEYRDSLIDKGLENVKKFSPDKVVADYKNIYNQISFLK